MLKRIAHFVLFGNYFLAFCIVALSVETGIKNGFFITDLWYYLFVFLSVTVYYTHAYINEKETSPPSNIRSRWYYENRLLIRFTQIFFTAIVLCLGIYFLLKYALSAAVFDLADWSLLFLFPFIALLYYGVIFPARFRFRLRNIAWLKPFLIGFVCTGIIVIYPMLFNALEQQSVFRLSIVKAHYFFTNLLFTTAIAIMFDIKDFAADHNYHLKTFVVARGLRFTIFFILLPMAAASFISFLFFAFAMQFSSAQIIINAIPFLLLLAVAASLRRRKGILYYLIIIDGLLFLKAAFGIVAILLVE